MATDPDGTLESSSAGEELEIAQERTAAEVERTKQAAIWFHTIGMSVTIFTLGLVFIVGMILNGHDHHFLQWLGGCLVAIGAAARWFIFGGNDDD